MSPLIQVAAAFLVAPLAGWLGGRSSPLIAALPAGLFAGFLWLGTELGDGGVLLESHAWIPSLGVKAAFRLDGLSLTFALLITGIGTLVFLYASAYLRGEPRLARFYVVLTLFTASMLGAGSRPSATAWTAAVPGVDQKLRQQSLGDAPRHGTGSRSTVTASTAPPR